eukprot:TRINITY_DN18066_c1_g1_i1.p1 TRINITY_DN18066_c1_g1~~TRINITY_DN18066_c1_g1_i1.p1  ORF type:complete len:607 (+),score=137.32 TRINITY_DN18066_c1_g1_i1:62-1822(+)
MEKHLAFSVYEPTAQTMNRDAIAIKTWHQAAGVSHELMEGYKAHEAYPPLQQALAPMLQFEEVTMPQTMRLKIQEKGFKRPSPVQSKAWPVALSGFDVVAIAETGSGKTLAFGLPAYAHCRGKEAMRDAPFCLVIAPTRELVMQIKDELDTFSPGLRVECAYGGTRVTRFGSAHIVCCTPGRLMDLCNRAWVDLSRVTYVVLDEADRMLDRSFSRDVDRIATYLPKERQTLMWTATWPREVAVVAKRFMPDGWVRLAIGYDYMRANTNIRQFVWSVEQRDKWNTLMKVMDIVKKEGKKALIFTNSRRMAEDVSNWLWQAGIGAWAMMGQLEQYERESRLRLFKDATPPAALVSTDLLQRGLDVKGLDIVVNYDMPKNIEDYTHRIGRTGRAGVVGDAYTFINESQDWAVLPHLVRVLTEAKQDVPQELARYQNEQAKRAWGGNDDPDGWGAGSTEEWTNKQAAGGAGWGETKQDDWGKPAQPTDDWDTPAPGAKATQQPDDWGNPDASWGGGGGSDAWGQQGNGASSSQGQWSNGGGNPNQEWNQSAQSHQAPAAQQGNSGWESAAKKVEDPWEKTDAAQPDDDPW